MGTELESLSDRLDRMLRPLGRTWRVAGPTEHPGLRFLSAEVGGEYSLAIEPGGILVTSSVPEGRYHALVTLIQLFPTATRPESEVKLLTGRVVDQPAFEWRGLMLDSSRHFQGVETIEWILELMSLHKLNRFHWHLTDDQGWRFPVPGWPRLIEVGAWRIASDGSRYGGFYSESDIRRIVAFAEQRHIVVVPEVDLPGHSSAALAAYPELSGSGRSREVPLEWGVADGVLSIGRASVRRFTKDVLKALVELFPGPWIHWGGDEVYRTPWTKNAESLAWMKTVNAASPEQALSAFWADLSEKTVAAGRIPIGWDEVALDNPLPQTVVQWWDDASRALGALKAGNRVIASWKESSYLDYPEWDGDGDRAVWMPTQTLDSIANHPFWPPGTPASARPRLLGLEAVLWSERVAESNIGRKLFPRLALIADLAWSGVQGGARDWRARIIAHQRRLESWGVGMPPVPR